MSVWQFSDGKSLGIKKTVWFSSFFRLLLDLILGARRG